MVYPNKDEFGEDGRRAPNAPSIYPQQVPLEGYYMNHPPEQHHYQQQQQQQQQQQLHAPSYNHQGVVVQGQPVYVHQPAHPQGYYYPPQQAQAMYPPSHHPQQHHKMSAVEMQQYQRDQQHQQQGKGKPYLQSQPVNGGAGEGGDGGTADDMGADGEEGGGKQYQDVWAAILFLAHVGFIAYLAFGPGLRALRDNDLTTESPNVEPAEGGEEAGMEKDLTTVYIGLAVVLAAAVAWSVLWIGILLRNASRIITVALIGAVATSLVGAVLAFMYGNATLAIVCLVMAAIQGMWYYCVRDRIPFASMNLKCSATAVLKYPSILFLAGLLTFVQVGWSLMWQLAAFGVAISKGAEVVVIEGTSFFLSECRDVPATAAAGATASCVCARSTTQGLLELTTAGVCTDLSVFTTTISPIILFLLFISLFWGSLVVKNVVFCSASGMVADWWYNGENTGVVGKSFSRSMTTSFGSICFGSLILAVLRAMRQMLNQGRRQGQQQNACTCIVQCLMAIIERLMQIFNRYALVYCSVYGTSFRTSGRKTFDLFKRRGFTAIINDDLAETALTMVSLVIALLTGVVGYLYGLIFRLGSTWSIILGVVGFVGGLLLSLVIMSVLDAGVATVFVVFAEDPEAFAQAHPTLYGELVQAWAKIGYDPIRRNVTRI